MNAYLNYNEKEGVDRFYDRDITSKKWGTDIRYDGNYKIRANFEHNNNDELDNFTNRELLVSVTSLMDICQNPFLKKILMS